MKKQTGIILSIVMAIAILTIGGAYAWLTWTGTGTKTNTLTAGTLSFTYTDPQKGTSTADITLSSAMPVTDASAKATTIATDLTGSVAERTVTINNTGSVDAYWFVYVENTVTTNAIAAAQLSTVSKLSSATTWTATPVTLANDASCATSSYGMASPGNKKIILCGELAGGASASYDVRAFINNTATQSNLSGKTAKIQFTAYATQKVGR